ncbi:MAG: hypothetical protein QGH99_00280 [Pseudomonadales bacterium]|nr:hypothetical protein [Gammaproteobacteria bacterium]MDP7315949.1 hypothetical protein [Pseudomonadales bacterium]MDP7575372.1 hypothetical protein [Pseudomonadales bacterium]
MVIASISEVEFGEELPAFEPDTSLKTSSVFAKLVGWGWGSARFTDHEGARKEGLPGAMVPGILSQGYLVTMIHSWAPDAEIKVIDTVFRAAVIADEKHTITGVVTDINMDDRLVEIDLTVANEKDETRVFGTATVELPA